jgi:hypothetical protein
MKTPLPALCVISGVAMFGLAIYYGSGDDGSLELWWAMVAISSPAIVWGLKTSFKKSN